MNIHFHSYIKCYRYFSSKAMFYYEFSNKTEKICLKDCLQVIASYFQKNAKYLSIIVG